MFRNDLVVGAMLLKSAKERSHLQQQVVSPRLKELNTERQASYNLKRRALHRGPAVGHKRTGPSSVAEFGQHGAAAREAVERAILDASPTSLAVLDASGIILHVNRAWCRYADRYGFATAPYGLGLDYADAWQEIIGCSDDADDVAEGIQRILAGTETVFHKAHYCADAVAPRWILMRAARFDLPGEGGTFQILVTHEDITSNIQAIDAVPDGEKHLRDVLDHISEFVAVLAPDGTVIECNRSPLEAAGITPDEVEGMKIWDCSWWDNDARAQDQLRRACERAAGGETARSDVTVQMADNRMTSIDFMLAPLTDVDGNVTCLIASAFDITERKTMENALRDLSARLIGVQEEERRRIARELHDDLNQRMAILSIELQQLDRAAPEGEEALHTRIQNLWTRAQGISAEIHRMSYQLHPSAAEHLGLAVAVQDLCCEVSEHQGLKIEFRQDGFPAMLPTEVALCAFRIVQESLHNVIAHSGADEAIVVLEKTDQAVSLSISDEGCGFDVESAGINGGLGLISMRERLRLVGGEIVIRSQPSRGTQIEVSIPLARQA